MSEFLLNKYLLIAKVVVLLICHCEGKWHQFLEITNRSLVEERGGHLETGIILSTAGGALYQERKITILILFLSIGIQIYVLLKKHVYGTFQQVFVTKLERK